MCAQRSRTSSSTATCTAPARTTDGNLVPGPMALSCPRSALAVPLLYCLAPRCGPSRPRPARYPVLVAESAFGQSFELVERGLRLARAERIGIERGKTIQRGRRSSLRRVRHAGGREQIAMRIASRAELIEPREIRSRLADRIGGNAGELRDLQTVAAVGRPLGDLVQKHDAVLVL